jgi:uncharacterized SAM-binding protein YcdF (DUF218 family)
MIRAPLASAFENKAKRLWRVAHVALCLLLVWMLLAWIAARSLIVNAELPQADAIAVLAGSGAFTERAQHAAQLFRDGRASKILLTNDNMKGGWSRDQQRNPMFVERAAEELQQASVPTENITVLWQPVHSTYDEAMLLRKYAVTHGLRSILIVTSAYHSRRALWIMRRVFQGSGITIGLQAVPLDHQTPGVATWWWSLDGWQLVGSEHLKQIYYWFQYG